MCEPNGNWIILHLYPEYCRCYPQSNIFGLTNWCYFTSIAGWRYFTRYVNEPGKVSIRSSKSGGLQVQWQKLVWNDNISHSSEDEKSFVGFILIYTDKISMTSKTNITVFYPIQVTLANFSDYFGLHLFDHGHTLFGLLPVGFQKTYSDD